MTRVRKALFSRTRIILFSTHGIGNVFDTTARFVFTIFNYVSYKIRFKFLQNIIIFGLSSVFFFLNFGITLER